MTCMNAPQSLAKTTWYLVKGMDFWIWSMRELIPELISQSVRAVYHSWWSKYVRRDASSLLLRLRILRCEQHSLPGYPELTGLVSAVWEKRVGKIQRTRNIPSIVSRHKLVVRLYPWAGRISREESQKSIQVRLEESYEHILNKSNFKHNSTNVS